MVVRGGPPTTGDVRLDARQPTPQGERTGLGIGYDGEDVQPVEPIMRPVTIYTDEICTLCHSVENLLNVRDVPYEKVMVDPGSDAHDRLVARTGMRSLPQVFIGTLLLGGYEETLAADQSGMLADLLVD